MAQSVLSREDPTETFFKNVPSKPAPLEVIYPVSRSGVGGVGWGGVGAGGGGGGGGGGCDKLAGRQCC